MELRSAPAHRPTIDSSSAFLVASGGAAGAATRWATSSAIHDTTVALVVVNAVGAFILGALVRHRAQSRPARLWLGIGFCGALTTFSTLAVEVADRLDRGEIAGAGATTAIPLGVGLLAAIVGNRAGPRPRRTMS